MTGYVVASDISAGLARNALAVKVNGQIWDLMRPIEQDAAIATRRRDVYLSRDSGKTWQQIARQGEGVRAAAGQSAASAKAGK